MTAGSSTGVVALRRAALLAAAAARRLQREAVIRARRDTLPDLAARRAECSLDLSPAPSMHAWLERETARAAGHSLPLEVQLDPNALHDLAIAVVCVTNRPHNIDAVIANIVRQTVIEHLHAVIVLNESGFDVRDIEARLGAARCGRVTVMWVPPEQTLGECLRRGLAATSARYVAKMDDDDTYGPSHLEESIAALRWSGAAVTGKHTYLVHMEATGETAVRFPGRDWSWVGYVAGGTIVMDRDRTAGASFGTGNVGEDSAFLHAVERARGLILSSSALGYVQRRGDDNTWVMGADEILRDATVIGVGDLRPLVADG
jgi:hypothetical protein